MEKTVRAADGSPLRSKGADIYSDLRLGFDEACLGASKTISTLSGTATVKVPPGTSSGKKLRLRGQGQLRSDGSYGDHYAVIQIDVPAQMSKESKKALAKLMKALAK